MIWPTWLLLVILWAPILVAAGGVLRWAFRESRDVSQLRRAADGRAALGRAARRAQ